MSMWFWAIVAAFAVTDAIVLLVVSRQKLMRSGLDFTKLRAVSKQIHDRAGEYMRANYSGDPDQLPQALSGFLSLADDIARSNGCALDAATLELLVKTSIANHRIATRAQVDFALQPSRARIAPPRPRSRAITSPSSSFPAARP